MRTASVFFYTEIPIPAAASAAGIFAVHSESKNNRERGIFGRNDKFAQKNSDVRLENTGIYYL